VLLHHLAHKRRALILVAHVLNDEWVQVVHRGTCKQQPGTQQSTRSNEHDGWSRSVEHGTQSSMGSCLPQAPHLGTPSASLLADQACVKGPQPWHPPSAADDKCRCRQYRLPL
jgi:hypothetical protein